MLGHFRRRIETGALTVARPDRVRSAPSEPPQRRASSR